VAAEAASVGGFKRLEHESTLRAELDAAWAARPVELLRYNGGWALVLEDPGGAPLDREVGIASTEQGEASPFSGSSNGGFWSRKVENALSFNGD
jgi:hypothetical protein